MSTGQLPRIRTFFPRMKVRRPHRNRPWMVTLYDENWKPLWHRRGSNKTRWRFSIGEAGSEAVLYRIPKGEL